MPRFKKDSKSLAELIQILDNGTTLYDILYGFNWYRKEIERLSEKNKKRYEILKESKKKTTAEKSNDNPAT